MSAVRDPNELQRAVDGAAAALSRATGVPVELTGLVSLADDERRNLILRASAICPDAAPRSVIVKATRDAGYDPAAPDAFEKSGLVKEWTATAWLARQAPGRGHSPTFLAGDVALGLLVFEDLGAQLGNLVQPLLDGSAAEAESALLAYAASLGHLHADTLGCAGAHAAALHHAFPKALAQPPVGGAPWQRDVADKVADTLGGALPEPEIGLVAQHMAEPRAWLGLVHRDPCPDNVLLAETGARLLDFESAGPGHILLDATYRRMGFPTCWRAGRVPPGVGARTDRVYHDALGTSLPLVRDDEAYATETTLMLFARMFASLSWLLEQALKEDADWGISTRRRRPLWHLQAAIDGAIQSDTLPGQRTTASRWLADLAGHWPEAQPLAFYPAFGR